MRKFLCYDTEAAARGEINVDSRGMLTPPSSGGVSSWNDLKDKPFYNEKTLIAMLHKEDFSFMKIGVAEGYGHVATPKIDGITGVDDFDFVLSMKAVVNQDTGKTFEFTVRKSEIADFNFEGPDDTGAWTFDCDSLRILSGVNPENVTVDEWLVFIPFTPEEFDSTTELTFEIFKINAKKIGKDEVAYEEFPFVSYEGQELTEEQQHMVCDNIGALYPGIKHNAQQAIPVVTTTGDGSTYVATIDGMGTPVKGNLMVIIPHTDSTTGGPRLNVNGKTAQLVLSGPNQTGDASNDYTGTVTSWIRSGYPLLVIFEGTKYRILNTITVKAHQRGCGAGVCTTEASRANKVVNDGTINYEMVHAGVLLAVKFTNGNTAENPTLRCYTSGAFPIVDTYENAIAPDAIVAGKWHLFACYKNKYIMLQ